MSGKKIKNTFLLVAPTSEVSDTKVQYVPINVSQTIFPSSERPTVSNFRTHPAADSICSANQRIGIV